MTRLQSVIRVSRYVGVILSIAVSAPTLAQEVRYSYLQMSYMTQDVDELGMQTPIPGQTVDYNASDGNGIRFRGSIGTWNGIYLFIDYGSTDIDLSAFIVSPLIPGGQTAVDEFDLTTVRGGVGYKYTLTPRMDTYVEATYDSTDLDFGSFALENFDTGEKDFGAAIGVRYMLNDDVELRGWARYSSVGDVNLNTLAFDTDTLAGVGFGWQVVRGLSIIGDFEAGEFGNLSLGFRLDLDEN